MGLPEWCQTHSLRDFLELMEDSVDTRGNKDYSLSMFNQEGKTMNEHIHAGDQQAIDPAFAPMDKAAKHVGPQPDGTVTYEVVEGRTYRDNEHVKPEIVGHVQIVHPEGEGQ